MTNDAIDVLRGKATWGEDGLTVYPETKKEGDGQ